MEVESGDAGPESDDTGPKSEQLPALSGNVDGQKPPLPEEAKALSKNAKKVLAKQERLRQVKEQRKAQAKEQRHQETERKRREWKEKLATMSEEETQKLMEEKMEVRAARKVERKGRKDKLIHAMAEGLNIVIDLEFGDKMTPTEINSLVQQVTSYSSANCPSHFLSSTVVELRVVVLNYLKNIFSEKSSWIYPFR